MGSFGEVYFGFGTRVSSIENRAPCAAFLIFGDIEGKLDVLNVECKKCARKGRYHVDRLIELYGRKGNMSKCPKARRS